jgi:hypothetical protein
VNKCGDSELGTIPGIARVLVASPTRSVGGTASHRASSKPAHLPRLWRRPQVLAEPVPDSDDHPLKWQHIVSATDTLNGLGREPQESISSGTSVV